MATQKRHRLPRRRHCSTGKLRLPDRASALRKIETLKHANPDRGYLPTRTYHCPTCNGWHLTSKEYGW